MKKSLLILPLVTLFSLSACDDQQLVQQLQKAQEQVTQLTEQNRVLAAAQADFPALQVEIVELFNQTETLTFEKDPKDEFAREKSELGLFISTAKTGVEWLDKLLLKTIVESYVTPTAHAKKQPINDMAAVRTFFAKTYQEMKSVVQQEKPIGYQSSLETYYDKQRNQLVTFMLFFREYSGGAHDMYYSRYLNIDINKKSILHLDDIISPENQGKVQEMLWKRYLEEQEQAGISADYITQDEFFIAQNFTFAPSGIIFIYPIYSIGPFVEGEKEIFLSFDELKGLLNNEYFPSKKDGYNLNPIEL